VDGVKSLHQQSRVFCWGMVLGPTIFEVTSGYSTSEKILFLREQRLLAELETEVIDS